MSSTGRGSRGGGRGSRGGGRGSRGGGRCNGRNSSNDVDAIVIDDDDQINDEGDVDVACPELDENITSLLTSGFHKFEVDTDAILSNKGILTRLVQEKRQALTSIKSLVLKLESDKKTYSESCEDLKDKENSYNTALMEVEEMCKIPFDECSVANNELREANNLLQELKVQLNNLIAAKEELNYKSKDDYLTVLSLQTRRRQLEMLFASRKESYECVLCYETITDHHTCCANGACRIYICLRCDANLNKDNGCPWCKNEMMTKWD